MALRTSTRLKSKQKPHNLRSYSKKMVREKMTAPAEIQNKVKVVNCKWTEADSIVLLDYLISVKGEGAEGENFKPQVWTGAVEALKKITSVGAPKNVMVYQYKWKELKKEYNAVNFLKLDKVLCFTYLQEKGLDWNLSNKPVISALIKVNFGLPLKGAFCADRGLCLCISIKRVPTGLYLQLLTVTTLMLIVAAFWVLSDLSSLLCSVNVQHNCAAGKCDLSGTRVVYLERERQAENEPAVRHFQTDLLVLNTAKMRDAKHIQYFATSPPPLNGDKIVQITCEMELEGEVLSHQVVKICLQGIKTKLKGRHFDVQAYNTSDLRQKRIWIDEDEFSDGNSPAPAFIPRPQQPVQSAQSGAMSAPAVAMLAERYHLDDERTQDLQAYFKVASQLSAPQQWASMVSFACESHVLQILENNAKTLESFSKEITALRSLAKTNWTVSEDLHIHAAVTGSVKTSLKNHVVGWMEKYSTKAVEYPIPPMLLAMHIQIRDFAFSNLDILGQPDAEENGDDNDSHPPSRYIENLINLDKARCGDDDIGSGCNGFDNATHQRSKTPVNEPVGLDALFCHF
ncbi:hypothetical protein SERLADRAFT_406227 [Serpula lacrymans var. lacrymans S7.9]|uniref:Myb/SANT-like domain-containing protein n=1 Tax=Serpula lacrymans var. lacrymans (strain S7.9) TaxID=578457 RepID=F8NKW5_SERL9|nr:uncharacterized protein SERLADRAFT_406227 [Serpula lacrymans var. lacrymans S7.9]EGO28834.1 hypothetical protein SERLADRAFT_406227 [Serpula lacrymans var. lacrymans S7.9]